MQHTEQWFSHLQLISRTIVPSNLVFSSIYLITDLQNSKNASSILKFLWKDSILKRADEMYTQMFKQVACPIPFHKWANGSNKSQITSKNNPN